MSGVCAASRRKVARVGIIITNRREEGYHSIRPQRGTTFFKTHRQVHGRRPARPRGRAHRRGPPRHATTRPTARPRPSRSTLATCRWSHRPTSRSSRTISTTTAGAAHERHTTFLNTYHHHQQAAEELGAARSTAAPGSADALLTVDRLDATNGKRQQGALSRLRIR